MMNWGLDTGWGDVRITRLTLVGDDGMNYSALMYVPKNATNETPAPGIVMYHGNSGNARNHEAWALEFSRRGYVCLSVDNNGAGDGEYSGKIGNLASPDMFTNYFMELCLLCAGTWFNQGGYGTNARYTGGYPPA